METQDGPESHTIFPIPEEPPQPQEATVLTMLKPGTRSLIRYKPIGDGEIDNKLKHWVYERIILWRVEGTLFVATPDYELCFEQLDWWAECWPLQNGHHPPCAHDFGRNLVYHFHKAFNIMELTELVSVGRLNAQQWCRRHGQQWEEYEVGVDFFGGPFS